MSITLCAGPNCSWCEEGNAAKPQLYAKDLKTGKTLVLSSELSEKICKELEQLKP